VRYDDPATRQALAAEYVLGTLRGRARRRFERLMRERTDWRDEVDRWSGQLAGLAATAPAIDPPPTLWRKILDRTSAPRAEASAVRWWKALAISASVAVVALAIALIMIPYGAVPPPQVAVLKDPEARTGWVITFARTKTGDAEIHAVVESARPISDRAFELWALPGAGARPVSLGLLPSQGEVRYAASAAAVALLRGGTALAVSVEPPGGSPTGQPTGPVVYQGIVTEI
jgi:anti-sigma-K factor RskA